MTTSNIYSEDAKFNQENKSYLFNKLTYIETGYITTNQNYSEPIVIKLNRHE